MVKVVIINARSGRAKTFRVSTRDPLESNPFPKQQLAIAVPCWTTNLALKDQWTKTIPRRTIPNRRKRLPKMEQLTTVTFSSVLVARDSASGLK
jgi:hypothetical protein